MSAWCHERTQALQQARRIDWLFNHLVSAAEQRQRKSEAKRLGRLKIDHELDFHSQLNREIARLFTLENPARVNAGQTISVGHVATIAHQAAGSCELVRKVHRRHRVARGKRDELVALFIEDRIGGKGQRGDPPLDEMRKRSVDVVVAARVLDNYLQAQRAPTQFERSKWSLRTSQRPSSGSSSTILLTLSSSCQRHARHRYRFFFSKACSTSRRMASGREGRSSWWALQASSFLSRSG